MWVAIFSIAIAVSILLIIVAIIMRDRDPTSEKLTRFSPQNSLLQTAPVNRDLKALVASPEVQSMMHADHIKQHEILAQLSAVSMQRQRNATSVFTFDMAVHRLRNMSEMMDRLGFDADALARSELNMIFVFRACQKCPADVVCHDWLLRAPKSFERAPAFCPNAERFAEATDVTA